MKKFNIGDLVIVRFALKDGKPINKIKNIIGLLIKEEPDNNAYVIYENNKDFKAFMIYSVLTSCGVVTTSRLGIELL